MRFFNGLAFKIGGIVIAIEVLALVAMGFYYNNRFGEEVDRRIVQNVQEPGRLMERGLLRYDAVADQTIMRQLVGEELVDGMVVGVNGNVFQALNPADLGKDVTAIPGIDSSWFGSTVTRAMVEKVVEGKDTYLVSITPLFAVDGRTPFLFAYIKVRTNEAEAEKKTISRRFIIGLTLSVVLTSAVIFVSIQGIILTRLKGLLTIVRRVEAGDLTARVRDSLLPDEIGILQKGVNSMAIQLEEMIGTLEQRMAELKRAEAEIHKLNQELEKRVSVRTIELEAANRELEAFAYSISHDLRAPLRHIDGFLELLQRRTTATLDDQSRHYMRTISDSARKMGLLIDDLLSFSRLGRHAMVLHRVELGSLVYDIIGEFAPDAVNREIDWRIADLPVVNGDASLLRMVLVNLMGNALKYTRTRLQTLIEIGFLPGQDSEIVIFVRDNGVGFDMAYVDKLFGVFQRLHRADEFEGTGVGLAIAQRIIHRHGGRIWAEGEIDNGAAFYFSLPKAIDGI